MTGFKNIFFFFLLIVICSSTSATNKDFNYVDCAATLIKDIKCHPYVVKPLTIDQANKSNVREIKDYHEDLEECDANDDIEDYNDYYDKYENKKNRRFARVNYRSNMKKNGKSNDFLFEEINC